MCPPTGPINLGDAPVMTHRNDVGRGGPQTRPRHSQQRGPLLGGVGHSAPDLLRRVLPGAAHLGTTPGGVVESVYPFRLMPSPPRTGHGVEEQKLTIATPEPRASVDAAIAIPSRRAPVEDRRPRTPPGDDELAGEGDGDGSVPGRAARDDPATRAPLDDGLRLATGGGAAKRPAAVHHRDRRTGHPLHPRPFRTRGRVADHRESRLAGSIIEQLKIIDRLSDPTAMAAAPAMPSMS